MKGVKVSKCEGEEARKRLLEEGNLLTDYRIVSRGEHIILPVKEQVDWAQTVDYKFDKIERYDTFNDKLREFLTDDLMQKVHTFDSIGDIAVMEFDEALEPYAKRIAKSFLETNKHYRTVLSKGSAIKGEHRTRQYRHLAGRKGTVTRHKEYGLIFEIDLEKMFFTPRMANERKRVADSVSADEIIIDMFCGVGPFAISMAKNCSPKTIYAIDINKNAIKYLERNIEINKANGIIPIYGDAEDEIKGLPNADRIIMNLPMTAHEFLSAAMKNLKKDGIIHFYSIVRDDELEKTKASIHGKAEEIGRKASILNIVKIKPYSPYTYLTSFDIKIT
jgi:tRNA (guanine37-N1)-methyltransferase